MANSNTWDPFPFPFQGDADAQSTYAGVGLVMSQWEAIELDLSRLYSVFSGEGPSGAAMRNYGQPRIFRDRLTQLETAAERHFIKVCNQKTEGAFHQLVCRLNGFSARRNDVAHGIVMEVSKIRFFASRLTLSEWGEKQFLLVPPYYSVRQHDETGLPVYGYNSGQLQQLAFRLLELGAAVDTFRKEC